MGKRTNVKEPLAALESVAPNHPWVTEKEALSAAFDKAAAQYEIA